VHLTCEQMPDERLRIKVTDTGLGIPPEAVERLFVPFERVASQQSAIEGTGLGLPLSKRLAEAMGGTLEEVLRRLQTSPKTGQVPVAILSADARPGLIQRLLDQGARAFLTKPLDVKELLELIDTIAAEREQAASPSSRSAARRGRSVHPARRQAPIPARPARHPEHQAGDGGEFDGFDEG
jgi:CheY-like chemotaxis protein